MCVVYTHIRKLRDRDKANNTQHGAAPPDDQSLCTNVDQSLCNPQSLGRRHWVSASNNFNTLNHAPLRQATAHRYGRLRHTATAGYAAPLRQATPHCYGKLRRTGQCDICLGNLLRYSVNEVVNRAVLNRHTQTYFSCK